MLETAALNLKIRHQNEGKISKRYKLRLSKKHSKKANRISRPNSKKTNKNKERNRQWRILNPPLKWQKRLKRDKENLTAWIECSRYYSNSASWYRFPQQDRKKGESRNWFFSYSFQLSPTSGSAFPSALLFSVAKSNSIQLERTARSENNVWENWGVPSSEREGGALLQDSR